MIGVICQTCGEKVGVQSFLTAAQTVCPRCGNLLLGELEKGTRVQRPETQPQPDPLAMGAAPPSDFGRGVPAGLYVGMIAGALVGLAVVVLVSSMGPALTPGQRGAILGALAGVLLAPVLAISGFLSMLVLPLSFEGLLGDSLWTRLADALHQRRVRPLILPILFYVVLPMTLVALGGSKMSNNATLAIPAGLGAMLLGVIIGGICGGMASGRQTSSGKAS